MTSGISMKPHPGYSLRIPPPSGDFWGNEGGGILRKIFSKDKKNRRLRRAFYINPLHLRPRFTQTILALQLVGFTRLQLVDFTTTLLLLLTVHWFYSRHVCFTDNTSFRFY